jgi:hypothetical protein
MKTSFDPVGFVKQHGIVLASARGAVPNVAEAVAGETIRGSWWGHPKGSQIFRALSAIDESSDVLCFRLVDGKITFVHRRLWAALVRLAEVIGKERLTAIRQEHTDKGAHRNVATSFPEWVTPDIARSAAKISELDARAQLGPWLATNAAPRRKKRSK